MDGWMDGWMDVEKRDRNRGPGLRALLITALSPVKGFQWVEHPTFCAENPMFEFLPHRHSLLIRRFISDWAHAYHKKYSSKPKRSLEADWNIRPVVFQCFRSSLLFEGPLNLVTKYTTAWVIANKGSRAPLLPISKTRNHKYLRAVQKWSDQPKSVDSDALE